MRRKNNEWVAYYPDGYIEENPFTAFASASHGREFEVAFMSPTGGHLFVADAIWDGFGFISKYGGHEIIQWLIYEDGVVIGELTDEDVLFWRGPISKPCTT